LALLLASSVASAGPSKDAKKLFAEGLRLYAEKNFEEATIALKAAYETKPEQRTLFAWAQAARLSGQCTTSRELLATYVANGANAKQSRAAYKLMEECEPAEGEDAAASRSSPPPTASAPTIASAFGPAAVVPVSAAPTMTPHPAAPGPQPSRADASANPWYKDWVAVGLVSSGVVGLAIGGFKYSEALGYDRDGKGDFVSYEEFLSFKSKSQDSRDISMVATATGGLLLGAGALYIFMRGDSESHERGLSIGLDSDHASIGYAGSWP